MAATRGIGRRFLLAKAFARLVLQRENSKKVIYRYRGKRYHEFSMATKKTTSRKPNAAFMKPVTPDEDLAAIVGSTPLPRTELTKKLWAYIKKHNLQDAKEKRIIHADDKLKPVFGGKSKVDMFQMTKLVNEHVTK